MKDDRREPLYIHVKVATKAKQEQITKTKDGHYQISVKVKPERGEANRRVRELLAAELELPEKRLRLIKGANNPSKLFQVL